MKWWKVQFYEYLSFIQWGKCDFDLRRICTKVVWVDRNERRIYTKGKKHKYIFTLSDIQPHGMDIKVICILTEETLNVIDVLLRILYIDEDMSESTAI